MNQLAELIQKAKNKDRKAQTALYHEFKVGWYAICLRYCNNKGDASDALQNALINIFQKMQQFDTQKGNFKSWSSKIIVNESLMLLRSKKNAFSSIEIIDDTMIDQEMPEVENILSVKEITKLIQSLPLGYRMVFNLYVIEGYKHIEIAEKLGVSIGTSKSQLSKARKLLQQKLEVIL